MRVPADAPEACPVCDREYDSVSEHDAGVAVNLLDNERYRRVCFQPRPEGRLWFYHHTHDQTGDGEVAAGTTATDAPDEDPVEGERFDD